MSNYHAILAAAWAEHLAPRAADAPTVISTFAGCGGSSLGYSMAGFRELLAVEWDNNAVATFALNFPDVPIYHGDIAALSVADVLARTGLKPGELDVFDGSPPCQGFSTAGKRNMDDSRNQLFREYVRLLDGLQPRVFVMENVSGMVKGKMKLVFVEILKALKACGYQVSARLLNAMYFGVPQSRQRVIFIGVRNDLAIVPTHPRGAMLPITFAEASQGCVDGGRELGEFLLTMGLHQPRGSWSSNPKLWRHLKGNLGGSLSTKWADADKTPGTLIKSWIAMTGVIHPSRTRYLNLAECKRIGSIPDEYHFPGTFSQAIQGIGNSVPPLFMRAIARHIRTEMLKNSTGQKAVRP